MKKYYQTILLGATMTALGYAHTHSDCLILEQSEFLAPEYTLSLRPVCRKVNPHDTPLAAFLTQRRVIDGDGVFHTLPLLPALCEYVLQEELDVLLLTQIVSVQPAADHQVVTIYNTEGLQEIHAGQVLDTRPVMGDQKYFHLVCHEIPSDMADRLQAVLPAGISVKIWSAQPESYISFLVPASCTLFEIRKFIADCWVKAFPQLQAQISTEAFEFDLGSCDLYGDTPLVSFSKGEQM